MNANLKLDAESEVMIVQLLGEAIDLVELAGQELPKKGTSYYLQSLFLVLQQMGYFFTENSSPLKSQIGTLTAKEIDVADRIKTIRDAIGHRESKLNFANASMKLVGGMRFDKGDVEIQYGTTNLYLLAEILANHRKYRSLFGSAPELGRLTQHPSWALDEQKLTTAETLLSQKLSNPQEMLDILRKS
ncbi:MAG: hypothetical protein A2Z88_03635 [Omnitrophica WOR_2 bacterium GWA2_47_8]|nr:MAG: hypothetical protein A2Z88_03635 [Omnitrophica WOR_2 bacterium GWA2_47_8]